MIKWKLYLKNDLRYAAKILNVKKMTGKKICEK